MTSTAPAPAHVASPRLTGIERALQAGIVSISVLTTVMLGLGEQRLGPAAACIIAALAVSYANYLRGWYHLSAHWSNALSLLALLAAGLEVQPLGPERLLLAMAHLLMYLEVVLLFRAASAENYWYLLLVDLLKVAMAAALNLDVSFGLLLVLYLFGTLMTLGLFFLWREALDMARSRGAVAFTGHEFRASDQSWPLRGFVARLSLMGLGTLVMSLAFFLIVPRYGSTNWEIHDNTRMVGFTDRVSLGDIGEIIQSEEEVLTLSLFNAETGAAVTLTDLPLLRGTALSEYNNGDWRASEGSSATNTLPFHDRTEDLRGLVRQRIAMAPQANAALFHIGPAVVPNAGASPPVKYYSHVASFRRDQPSKRATFELLTPGIYAGRQLRITPALSPFVGDSLLTLPEGRSGDPFPELRRIADEVVARLPENERSDIVSQAMALEAYLRFEGEYRYAMLPVKRQPNIDPVEDFVANRKEGHCEFFASALTLMLRHRGIPARVVVGYRASGYNQPGGYWQVEQAGAHAWVEVYLNNFAVPESLPGLSDYWLKKAREQNGAWLTLDPTPAGSGQENNLAGAGWFGLFKQWFDYASFLWTNYVLGLDAQWQVEAIYQPFSNWLSSTFRHLFEPRAWIDAWTSARSWLGQRLLPGGDQQTARWRNTVADGVIALVLAMAAVGLGFLARWSWRRWARGGGAARRARGSGGAEVDFYWRFERLLGWHGLRRDASQTPREFAGSVAGELADLAVARGQTGLPRQLVDAFYRVRFGGAPLDNREAEQVEQALVELTKVLRQRAAHRSKRR